MPTKMSDTTQKQEGFFLFKFCEIIKNLVNVSKKLSQEISQIYYTMEKKIQKSKNFPIFGVKTKTEHNMSREIY
jgi:hypothetical protein